MSKWDPKAPQLKPHHFKPGKSGNPGGRPANPIPNALKKLTLQQYRRIIKAIVKGNIDEVRRVVKDPKSCSLEVAIAACYLKAIERGDYDTVEKMLQRIVGKIPDVVEVNSRNLTMNANLNAAIPTEKLKAAILKLEEEV